MTSERSDMSSQLIIIPAAFAMAIKCMVWLVEPPVANNPIMPLTILSSLIIWDKLRSNPKVVLCLAIFTASSLSKVLNWVPGFTKLDPGSCKPIISMSI